MLCDKVKRQISLKCKTFAILPALVEARNKTVRGVQAEAEALCSAEIFHIWIVNFSDFTKYTTLRFLS